MTFPWPLCDDFALRDAAWKLLDAYLEPEIPVRLIGFGVEHLTDSPSPYDADDLFATLSGEAHPRQRQETISKTMDQLRKRYGNAIRDASSVIPKTQDDK